MAPLHHPAALTPKRRASLLAAIVVIGLFGLANGCAQTEPSGDADPRTGDVAAAKKTSSDGKAPMAKAGAGAKNVTLPPNIDTPPDGFVKDDDDEDRRKRDALKKGGPIRKTPPKGNGGEPQFNPITPVKVPATPVKLPNGIDLARVNASIANGVAFLKRHQHPSGAWHEQGFASGHTALAGLALLECQVPPTDPMLQRGADIVRGSMSGNPSIYEMSLVLLFLDRLGDPRDRPLIQGLALQIMAAQADGGGWDYNGPKLDPQEMYQLFAFLHTNKAPSQFNPKWANSVAPHPLPPADVYLQFSEQLRKTASPPAKVVPIRAATLSPKLRDLYCVQNYGVPKGQFRFKDTKGDNSNTQFALLALWAARRHDVPADHAILAAHHRLTHSQCADGSWAYNVGIPKGYATMTCVGLLGEAMGHAISPDVVRVDPKNPKSVVIRPALEDPKIKAGLARLSTAIGSPTNGAEPAKLDNIYLLWSIERVAMLYDLQTIGGKDWYGWGVDNLVKNQQDDGHWAPTEHFTGSREANTSLALLFLKRSNLVPDLTENLRLQTFIRE